MYTSDLILEHFSLPIKLIKNVKEIDDTVIDELECIQSKDMKIKPMYHYVFSPDNVFSEIVLNQWAKYYTTDKRFLTDSIQLYKTYKPIKPIVLDASIEDTWKTIKNDNGFIEKYQYIDWEHIKIFNKSSLFLFYLSVYTILSPVLSLITPIMFLFLPFLVLKLKGIPITLNKYTEVLKTIVQRHAIGAFFTNFTSANLKEKMSLIASVGFYCFQMYQNILICYRFMMNFKLIHDYIDQLRSYLHTVKDNMDEYQLAIHSLRSYEPFHNKLQEKKKEVETMLVSLDAIQPLSFSVNNFLDTGKLMKEFYMLHDNYSLQNTLAYCFGFTGYLQNIVKLQSNKHIHYCTYSNKKLTFTKAYYPPLIESKGTVKNSYELKKNYIITGPNASGKTTLLKTTFLNVLFSQQFGGGFYEKATIMPQDHFYCYINIPDTSGRDSLFQAEARQCKKILDKINKEPNESHFIIFDELYSGTNPYEASASAYGYLKYLKQKKNVRFMLTTHFIDLCSNLKSQKAISNKHMKTSYQDKKLFYHYKLTSGISDIKGGLQVLYDLDYPKIITDEANHILIGNHSSSHLKCKKREKIVQ